MEWINSLWNKKPTTDDLYKAIHAKDRKRVATLIRNGVDLNPPNDRGPAQSPLFSAVNTGDVEMVRLLLDFGATRHCVGIGFGFEDCPLYCAIQHNYPEIAKLLIERDPTHLTEKNTIHIVSLTIIWKSVDVFRMFMEMGIDPNGVDTSFGRCGTLLNYAISLQKPEWVLTILNYGARIDVCPNGNFSAYRFAKMCYPGMVPFLTSWEPVLVKRVGRDVAGMVKDYVVKRLR